jgi:hypothetical protein
VGVAEVGHFLEHGIVVAVPAAPRVGTTYEGAISMSPLNSSSH